MGILLILYLNPASEHGVAAYALAARAGFCRTDTGPVNLAGQLALEAVGRRRPCFAIGLVTLGVMPLRAQNMAKLVPLDFAGIGHVVGEDDDECAGHESEHTSVSVHTH